MKKVLLLLFFSFFILLSSFTKAQNAGGATAPKPPLTKSKEVKEIEKNYFGCVKCDFISKVPGTCPHDQLTLVRVGNYYCPVLDGYTSEAAGQCPKHKIPLNEMEFKYQILYPLSTPPDKQVK